MSSQTVSSNIVVQTDGDVPFALGLMSDSDKDSYLALQGKGYAESLFNSGICDSFEIALERASTQLKSLLASVVDRQLFAWMLSGAEKKKVGVLWWAVRGQDGRAWIYDIEVYPEARRQGHARRAILALQEWCRREKVSHIGLNVFAFNTGAEKLYREMGFEDVSKQMRKAVL